MARVLVVGGNGFIGSHVVDGLVRAGHDVVVFDRFSSGVALYTSTVADTIVGDFLNRNDIARAVEGVDVVLHFLSTTTPVTAHGDPSLDITTNVAPTIELLRACVGAGVRRVVFASTGGAIYGPQDHSEYSEDDPALPVSPYGIGKLAIERYLAYFRATAGLESVSLRISNPFGPRQHLNRKQGLIPIALRQIAQGLPVTRYGDGSMVRDYVYVADLVDMVTPFVDRDVAHEVYNVGSGHGHTVTEVFDALARVTGVDFEIIEQPVPSTFVDRVVLNVDRLRAELGELTLTPLDEGIRATYREIERQVE